MPQPWERNFLALIFPKMKMKFCNSVIISNAPQFGKLPISPFSKDIAKCIDVCCESVVITLSHEIPSHPSQSFTHICQMMLSPNAGEAGHSQVVEYSHLKWFAFP